MSHPRRRLGALAVALLLGATLPAPAQANCAAAHGSPCSIRCARRRHGRRCAARNGRCAGARMLAVRSIVDTAPRSTGSSNACACPLSARTDSADRSEGNTTTPCRRHTLKAWRVAPTVGPAAVMTRDTFRSWSVRAGATPACNEGGHQHAIREVLRSWSGRAGGTRLRPHPLGLQTCHREAISMQ